MAVGSIGPGVGPLVDEGLDETLSLAVGLGGGARPLVTAAQAGQDVTVGMAAMAGAVSRRAQHHRHHHVGPLRYMRDLLDREDLDLRGAAHPRSTGSTCPLSVPTCMLSTLVVSLPI